MCYQQAPSESSNLKMIFKNSCFFFSKYYANRSTLNCYVRFWLVVKSYRISLASLPTSALLVTINLTGITRQLLAAASMCTISNLDWLILFCGKFIVIWHLAFIKLSYIDAFCMRKLTLLWHLVSEIFFLLTHNFMWRCEVC